jgi:hypothetical protein
MDEPMLELLKFLGQALIAGAVTCVLAWMSQRTKNAVDKNTTITQNVHALVNNAMGIQLKTTADALHALANITHDAKDVRAAADAMSLYDQHMAGQRAIDREVSEKIDPGPPRPPPLPRFPSPPSPMN